MMSVWLKQLFRPHWSSRTKACDAGARFRPEWWEGSDAEKRTYSHCMTWSYQFLLLYAALTDDSGRKIDPMSLLRAVPTFD